MLNPLLAVRCVVPAYGDPVIPISTYEAFTTGNFVQVPLLIGGNRDVGATDNLR